MWVFVSFAYLVCVVALVGLVCKRWQTELIALAVLIGGPVLLFLAMMRPWMSAPEPTDRTRAERLVNFMARRSFPRISPEERVSDQLVRSRIRREWDPTWDGPLFPLDDSGWPLDEHGQKVQLTLLSEPARVEVRTLGADGVAATEDDVVAVAEIGD